MDYMIYVRSSNPNTNYLPEVVGPCSYEDAERILSEEGFRQNFHNTHNWVMAVSNGHCWEASIVCCRTRENSSFFRKK